MKLIGFLALLLYTAKPAPVLPTLDLSTGSVEDLAARLLLQVKVHSTSDDLESCDDASKTCDAAHDCVLLDRKSCSTCEATATETCLVKLTASPAPMNVTAKVISPHSPSKSIESLQRSVRSKRPVTVKVDVHDPVIILDYESIPFFDNDNAISDLLGDQVLRKKDSTVGPNYSLVLHRHSQCRFLPSNHYLAMVFADPISNQLNFDLGRDLDHNSRQRSGVAYSKMFDGTTRVFLYSFTNDPMNHDDARTFCTRLGLALPTIRNLKDMSRIGLFTSVLHDVWIDGSDADLEGVWFSEVFKTNLNRMPWASSISGYTYKEDCVKARCDWHVNDWLCSKKLSVVCVRERTLHIASVDRIKFTPENWSRAVELGHCQPIKNLTYWMDSRRAKHVPGSKACSDRYIDIDFTPKAKTKGSIRHDSIPNCSFFPPSAYSCRRWNQKTLRKDLIQARKLSQRSRQEPTLNGTWLASSAALGIWNGAVQTSPSLEVLSYYTLFPCIAKHAMVLDTFLSNANIHCDACALLHMTSTLHECATKVALTPFRLQLVKEYFHYFEDGLETSKARDVSRMLITKFSDSVEVVSPTIENGRLSVAISMVLSQLQSFDHDWVSADEQQRRVRAHLYKLLHGIKGKVGVDVQLDQELVTNAEAARKYVESVHRLDDDAIGVFLNGLVGGFH